MKRLSSTDQNSNSLTNVPTPSAGGDAANKSYVDTANAAKVTGPASATDNAIARYDGTTGKLIQNSNVTIDDNGQIVSPTNGATGGIVMGSDTQFYRSAADIIRSDDILLLRPVNGTGGVIAGLNVDTTPSAPTQRTQGATIFGTVSNGCEPSGYVVGVEGRAVSNSTGTVPLAYGLNYSVENRSSGIMTQAYGVVVAINNYSTGSGSITTAFGIYASINGLGAGSATIGTAYGIYIPSMTGITGNSWGIYQIGTAQMNYLAGNLGLGVVSPTAKIQLAAATTAAGGLLFGTDTTLYRSAANTLKTDDELVIGINGGKDTLALTDTTADVGITIGADTNLYRSAANVLATDDDLSVKTAGKGLQIKEGSNARMGVSTLVAGTVTVANTSVTANTRIFLTTQSLGTVAVPMATAVTARTAATSFTITSADVTDTSVVAWHLIEPSA